MRMTHDPESGAWYVRVRDGEIEETVELAGPGFGARADIDREGNILGLEFLSFGEYAELVARYGGALELPEKIEDPETFRLGAAAR